MGEGLPPVGMFPKWPSELTGSSSPRAAAKATGYCRAGSETGLVAQRCLDSVRYPPIGFREGKSAVRDGRAVLGSQ